MAVETVWAFDLGKGPSPTASLPLANAGTLVQSDCERLIADWLTAHNNAYRYDERFRILSGHAVRPDFHLPELDLYIEYWGMDTADYKIGMLKKQQLYQQQGKRLISLYPADKPRLDTLLRAKLALFGCHLPAPPASASASKPATAPSLSADTPPAPRPEPPQ